MPKKSVDEKLDELAQMVARGFMEVRGEMKEMREELAAKEDLAQIRSEMATKADLRQLDKTFNVHQVQIDDLARRTKDLEVATAK
ncbi:MAG: hypothetical protein KGI78_03070 [Patescibacteria group bacterium]|nr:hypothetical protein [Patescibacteria group bacterium]MDE1944233.1 hypothetical protein [Patescibacteria group bacterium]MDE2057811.1 hypothetical protein [Patescibacteria group bacterium]